jgi:hypothetical protein
MYETERKNVFRKMLPKESWSDQEEETEEKIRRAYHKMKKESNGKGKSHKRGNAERKPELNEKVIVKTQPISDAARGITLKFFASVSGTLLD